MKKILHKQIKSLFIIILHSHFVTSILSLSLCHCRYDTPITKTEVLPSILNTRRGSEPNHHPSILNVLPSMLNVLSYCVNSTINSLY